MTSPSLIQQALILAPLPSFQTWVSHLDSFHGLGLPWIKEGGKLVGALHNFEMMILGIPSSRWLFTHKREPTFTHTSKGRRRARARQQLDVSCCSRPRLRLLVEYEACATEAARMRLSFSLSHFLIPWLCSRLFSSYYGAIKRLTTINNWKVNEPMSRRLRWAFSADSLDEYQIGGNFLAHRC